MMSIYFFDTSGLVKKYIRELGTDWVLQTLHPARSHRIYIAPIACVELHAALKRREEDMSTYQMEVVREELQSDLLKRFQAVDFAEDLLRSGCEMAWKHGLRGYDAIQLASALSIVRGYRRPGRHTPITFVTADAKLLHAAESEGFAVEDPNNHD